MDKQLIIEIAEKLTAAAGVSGRESSAAKVAEEYLSPLGEVKTTRLGSIVCRVNEGRAGAPQLLLEAHIDRIGLIVRCLDKDGFLRVDRVGGIDRRLLPASTVTVMAEDGPHCGVVAATPPHLAEGEPKPKKIDELVIDTGFSDEEARRIFAPGDEVIIDGVFARLGEDFISGPALDDRIGCAAVIAAAKRIAAEKPDCGVTVLLSSMEEVGGWGAATGAFETAPDYAIALDVSFGDGFGVESHKCFKLGGGPIITAAPILNKEFTKSIKQAAEKAGIKLQTEVCGSSTGTDADDIATSRGGVKTALLGIPLRSMHTTVETVSATDAAETAEVMVLAAREVK